MEVVNFLIKWKYEGMIPFQVTGKIGCNILKYCVALKAYIKTFYAYHSEAVSVRHAYMFDATYLKFKMLHGKFQTSIYPLPPLD